MEKVLITGASGLVGGRLKEMLLEKGFQVNTLGRSHFQSSISNLKHYTWNVEQEKLDKRAFEGVSAIIHLAGAGIAEKRWSNERKQEIIDSRVKSAKLIFDFLKNNKHDVKTFISASAVGYYGNCGNEIVTEEHNRGEGFLAAVCKQWEESATQFSEVGIREVRCRIGIVLAKQGGALPELSRTFAVGIAPYFAKSNLYYPWIHIDDACGIMIYALQNEHMKGAYNTTAPAPLPIKDLIKSILKSKQTKAVLLPTPPLAIKIAMGEMSELLLNSQRCNASKILAAGYKFKFGEIEKALQSLA